MSFEPRVLDEIIRNSGLSYKENRISYIFNCPRCCKKDKLYIRKVDGRFICWWCAAKEEFQGRCEYALAELLAEPYKEIKLKLYGMETVEATVFWAPNIKDFFGDNDEIDEEAFEIVKVNWPLDFYQIDNPKSLKGAEYLTNIRGIPTSLAKQYGLRYSPTNRRVYFPVEYDGVLCGWQGRLIIDNKRWDSRLERFVEFPKILSSTGIPRERCVMFSERLKKAEHAVLSEGPVDAMKAHLCGGNIATMGKVVTRSQIDLIRNCGIHKIYVALDPDAAEEAGQLIRSVDDVEFYNMISPNDSIDLGKMTFDDVHELFKSAKKMNRGHFYGYIKDFSRK